MTTDLIWWVCENPIRLRVAVYGAPLIAPFLLAALSGTSMYVALKVSGLTAVAFVIPGPLLYALRRAGLF